MDLAAALSTLASVAASLVGFSGLLTAFRASSEALSPYDVNNIRTLLIYSVSALLFALLPLPFLGMLKGSGGWGWLTMLLGANLLFWSVRSPLWMKRKGLRARSPLLYFAVILLQAIVGLTLVAVGWRLSDVSAFYAFGVLWFLLIALLVFIVQVFLLLPIGTARSDE